MSSCSNENSLRSTEKNKDDPLSNQKQIELWARAPGLLAAPVTILFLGVRCNLGLHHVKETTFRLNIMPLDSKSNL